MTKKTKKSNMDKLQKVLTVIGVVMIYASVMLGLATIVVLGFHGLAWAIKGLL